MTSQYKECKLCFNDVTLDNDSNLHVLSDNVKEMLETLLIKRVDLINEKTVICSTCHKKTEENYLFKNKCIFTERSIMPFVADNVNVNLNEIRNKIIQSEDVHADKNVCRLCLEFPDNEMTLKRTEKRELRKFFPEINLNLTNIVVLCLVCYDKLQKYLMFVKACTDLEKQSRISTLYNTKEAYDATSEQPLMNSEVQRNVVFLKEEWCSYPGDGSRNQNDSIEFESSHQSLTNTTENATNSLLHEEVQIKHERNSTEEMYTDQRKSGSAVIPTSEREKRENEIKIENHENLEESYSDNVRSKRISKKDCSSQQNNCSSIKYKCNDCTFQSKRKGDLKQHIRYKHTKASKVKKMKCKLCEYESKDHSNLRRHILTKHTDPSTVTMHKCENCEYISKFRENLKLHILRKHSDPSKIQMYKCYQCDYETKFKDDLKYHNRFKHTNPSKLTMYKCKSCDYESKFPVSLRRHIISKHTDPSKLETFTCQECDYETKHKGDLKGHIRYRHTDPSKVKMFKCTECDYESKKKENVRTHTLFQHTDPSNLKMYKCELCDYESKDPSNLKRHNISKHTDPSKIKMYKCEICDYQSRFSTTLKRHIMKKHTDASSAIYT